jgi:hypothetical protein
MRSVADHPKWGGRFGSVKRGGMGKVLEGNQKRNADDADKRGSEKTDLKIHSFPSSAWELRLLKLCFEGLPS